MLANNAQINWLPEHISDGRFGNFLETNVDWALSRERYWGTPLPIWVCEATRLHAKRSPVTPSCWPSRACTGPKSGTRPSEPIPSLSDHLKVHKPYIDAVTYDSRPRRRADAPRARSDRLLVRLGRDAVCPMGLSAPGAASNSSEQFPADFISEAIDQTRGWFYSQLAISTLLVRRATSNRRGPAGQGRRERRDAVPFPHPFRNCIVLGLMLGEDGQKMSKSKRNYREPSEIFDRYGADALRWYFFANQPPWTSIRYSEQAIKDSIPEFLLRLWNVYSFFVIYANIDGFDPAARRLRRATVGQLAADELAAGQGYRPIAERSELDRWILSELARTAAAVIERMDAYDNYAACAADHRVCRRAEQLVRPPQPRPLLGADEQSRRQARRLLDALRMPADDRQAGRPVRAVSGRGDVAEPGRGRRLAAERWRASTCAISPAGDAAAVDRELSARMGWCARSSRWAARPAWGPSSRSASRWPRSK